MNRARKPNETFKKYKANLKKEALELKQFLKGRFVHVSTKTVYHDKNSPPIIYGTTYYNPLKKPFCTLV